MSLHVLPEHVSDVVFGSDRGGGVSMKAYIGIVYVVGQKMREQES